VRDRKSGFTIVELFVVLAIITLVAGILLPSFTMVRRSAKQTKQKAQLTAIGLGLTAFKNDFGDYPESSSEEPLGGFYCGAQKLAEALVGWDLLGFHPDSEFNVDGYDDPPGTWFIYDSSTDDELKERKGYYIELETANVFKIGNDPVVQNGLFSNLVPPLAGETYVICDEYGVKRINVGNDNVGYDVVRAGAPILYYRANTSSKNMIDLPWSQRIYNASDNGPIINLGRLTRDGRQGRWHWLTGDAHYDLNNEVDNYWGFTLYVNDYRVVSNPDLVDPAARPWPHRPDSYLLISAGLDGLYGTADDITNFGN
jgi:type II secretory pathway pseudopilin PulG